MGCTLKMVQDNPIVTILCHQRSTKYQGIVVIGAHYCNGNNVITLLYSITGLAKC